MLYMYACCCCSLLPFVGQARKLLVLSSEFRFRHRNCNYRSEMGQMPQRAPPSRPAPAGIGAARAPRREKPAALGQDPLRWVLRARDEQELVAGVKATARDDNARQQPRVAVVALLVTPHAGLQQLTREAQRIVILLESAQLHFAASFRWHNSIGENGPSNLIDTLCRVKQSSSKLPKRNPTPHYRLHQDGSTVVMCDNTREHMPYRFLGDSGLLVSRLSLGSWMDTDEKYTVDAWYEMMALAFKYGINVFDNAEIYGAGLAERNMGEPSGKG
ncbi:NADP-dependent oxidoreductase domain [Phytophthora cactorum]|nr:NADP-dependent oxidoreductase domain [Phytophthora cactorum]